MQPNSIPEAGCVCEASPPTQMGPDLLKSSNRPHFTMSAAHLTRSLWCIRWGNHLDLILYNVPVNIGEKLILRCILFSLSLQRCSAHSGHTVIVLLLAWPRVCVCVCCVCFTWQETGTMLWLCLLFRNALASPAQHTQLALPSDGAKRGKGRDRQRTGTVTTNQLLSLSLFPSVSCYWWNKDNEFKPMLSHTDPRLNWFIHWQRWPPQAWKQLLFCQRVS